MKKFQSSIIPPVTNQPENAGKFPCTKSGFLPLTILLFFFLSGSVAAQEDTTAVKKHSPRKATIYSAVIPGLGQVYNRKYWKVPIVYAGIGTCAYFAMFSQRRYNEFTEAWRSLNSTNNPDSIIQFDGYLYTLNGLDAGRNYYRRNRDLFTIFTAGVYLMNIIDANVDAHLFDFDISDDLSLRLQPAALPSVYTGCITPGFTLKMTLR